MSVNESPIAAYIRSHMRAVIVQRQTFDEHLPPIGDITQPLDFRGTNDYRLYFTSWVDATDIAAIEHQTPFKVLSQPSSRCFAVRLPDCIPPSALTPAPDWSKDS